MRPPASEFEEVWLRLRRHLDRAHGFTLCLVFTPSRREGRVLQERLAAALRWRTSMLETIDPLANENSLAEALAVVTSASEGRIRMRSPVWLSLERDARQPEADAKRRALLAALNERRGTLEKAFARPLIVCLPVDYNQEVWTHAPDLWTIRGFVGELPPLAARASGHSEPRPGPEPPAVSTVSAPDAESAPAVKEWRRVAGLAVSEPERVSPAAAGAAFEVALGQGAIGLAREIAVQGLRLASQRRSDPNASAADERQRDLSISLDNLGRVAQAQGEWAQAEQAYRESLDIRRQLAERIGTPEAQRDLSVSLDNLGRVAEAQGEWAQAETALRESAAIGRALVERFQSPPAMLDELGVTLIMLGKVESRDGKRDALIEAQSIYTELARVRPQDGALRAKLRDIEALLQPAGAPAEAGGEQVPR